MRAKQVTFRHLHRGDLEQILGVWRSGRALALARFDHETRRILEGEDNWLKERLLHAEHFCRPGFHIGISPPCCQKVENTKYLVEMGYRARGVLTFSTIFDGANRRTWLDFLLKESPGWVVVSHWFGNYRVPKDPVNDLWDMDSLIEALGYERRPILVAAGAAGPAIIAGYWAKFDLTRQMILDVGHSLDRWIYGKKSKDPTPCQPCTWGRGV